MTDNRMTKDGTLRIEQAHNNSNHPTRHSVVRHSSVRHSVRMPEAKRERITFRMNTQFLNAYADKARNLACAFTRLRGLKSAARGAVPARSYSPALPGLLLLEERRENSRARACDCALRAATPEPCKGIRPARQMDQSRTHALLFLAQVNA